MNPAYFLPRLIRRFLPDGWTRFLLRRGWAIRPSLETTNAGAAVQRYADALNEHGWSLAGRRVLVFGYGGRFDIGVALLESGADSVVLCEKYARPDEVHHRELLTRYGNYLALERGQVRPNTDRMLLLEADIRAVTPADLAPMDLVVSNSVYEHLDDVDGITRALAALTRPGGLHIHYVDLRDHFFRYPFEMLCYSERVWRGWLNPSSNHNRYRVWDYRRVFESHFPRVELTVLERDLEAFEKIRGRIRPGFSRGDPLEDSVTLIRLLAFKPAR